MTAREKDRVTDQIREELWRLGIKCEWAMRLNWSTNKPIHAKSVHRPHGPGGNTLSAPYTTSLGYKTALKLLEELKQMKPGN